MNSDLASKASKEKPSYSMGRSPFLIDYGAIIHSSTFRRASHKTQVYMAPTQDFIRTRLTHSVEASQIGRQLARYLASLLNSASVKRYNMKAAKRLGNFAVDFEDLVASACLAHDLGHPPFGHRGEDVLKELLAEEGDEFDANKQNLRIILGSPGRAALDVTNALVDAIIKYKDPLVSEGKDACYATESEPLNGVLNKTGLHKLRHPAVYLMECADDIAYLSGDLEDALKLGEVSPSELSKRLNQFGAELLNSRYRREKALTWKKLIDEFGESRPAVVSSYFMKWLVAECCKNLKKCCRGVKLDELPEVMDDFARSVVSEKMNLLYAGKSGGDIKAAKDFLYKENLLVSTKVAKERIFGGRVLRDLWNIFSPLLNLEGKKQISESFEFNILPSHVKVRMLEKLSTREGVPRAERVRLIRDYLAGMTDRYAIDLWQSLTAKTVS